jgi:hypothetical protein
MKRIGTVAFCIVAVLVMGVFVSAASAFSPPEIGRCVKVAEGTGKFSSAACIAEKAKSSYEWVPGAVKNKFKTTGGSGTLQTVGGTAVGCKTESSGGEFNSVQTVTGVVVRFTGCKSAGFLCSTTGAKAGEIVTNALEGRIGFENQALKKLAFDLFPTAADNGLYVTFNCGGSLHVTVGGSVLVPLPSDKMALSLALKYVEEKGVQKPVHFEGEPNDVLLTQINGKAAEQSGVKISSTQANEELLEANAVF